ncbi:MAG: hypothetical protein LQ346_004272, partial [Caloplaca aetnensis]
LAFDAWAAHSANRDRVEKSTPISALSDSTIGVDAAYYLEGHAKEPLLSALGGFPLALESSIIREISDWQAVGITLHFVFNGLDNAINDDPFGPSLASARAIALAFDTYDRYQPSQAIELFRKSGTPTSAALSGFLKRVLHKHGLPFTVAPYSALAQLAYFEKHPGRFIDAIYGPSELFLYGVDKLITRINLVYQPYVDPKLGNTKNSSHFIPEQSEVHWMDRQTCLEELGRISPDLFIDSLLLAGSKALGPFPAFKENGYTIRDVVNLIASYGRSVVNLCNQFPEDKQVPRAIFLNYLDQFKRALTGIRHHVVITTEGDIEALNKGTAPSDLHDCVGQRLPEELNLYLSRGMVQPRVLNWLASGTILVPAPYDGGDSPIYQNLVQSQLEPMRQQALSLLADSIHRYYQRKEITTKYWFDMSYEAKFNIKDHLLPSPKESLSTWNVKEDAMLDRRESIGDIPLGSLSFALRSLQDVGFAKATITPRSKDGQETLRRREVICANAVWRFLQLRGYIDGQHQLTAWGKVLDRVLSGLGHSSDRERSTLLAVELLRLDLLKADTMFSSYSGAPFRGDDIDKRNCMLISRVACLGSVVHQPVGYSGPLSRHLLAYHAIIAAVQTALRDLVEMSVVTMFLEGYVDRDRDDWMEIALTLPLFDEDSCALGVVTLTYLDEFSMRPDPTSEATRVEMRQCAQGWVKHCDFDASQRHAFQLWDVVSAMLDSMWNHVSLTTTTQIYDAVKQANADGIAVEEVQMWDDVDQWLSQRR